MAARRYPTFRKTDYPGPVRHGIQCPLAFEQVKGKRCACDPTYRGVRRNPLTRKPQTSKTSKDRNWVKDWLRALDKTEAVEAVQERAQQGRTLGSLVEEFLTGAQNGTIARRRRGQPKPYSGTTIPAYRRDYAKWIKDGFGDRPAARIDESEWQELFDEIREEHGLSYSRAANIKAVVAATYEWAGHRTRRRHTGITANPLRHVDLGATDGKRRERVAPGLPRAAFR